MDSFLAFLHQKEEININEQKQRHKLEEEKKKNDNCAKLKTKFEDCVKLNRYILGHLFDDKIC